MTIASYEQYKRAVDQHESDGHPADRVGVGEALGLGRLQSIAFAARLGTERGDGPAQPEPH